MTGRCLVQHSTLSVLVAGAMGFTLGCGAASEELSASADSEARSGNSTAETEIVSSDGEEAAVPEDLGSLSRLREVFNEGRGKSRLILLLSPT